MIFKKKLAILGGAALLAFSASASAVTVDLFSTDQGLLSDSTTSDGGLTSSVDTVGTDILGGSRDLYVELVSRAVTSPFSTADLGVGGGALSFSVGTEATGTAVVQWDGNDHSPLIDTTGLQTLGVGIDLTEAGTHTAFGVNTLFADADFLFTITAWTDDDNWTAVTLGSHAVGLGSGVFSAIGFDSFTNAADCGSLDPEPGVIAITCGGVGGDQVVDLSNLGALQLVIDPLGSFVSLDLTLDSIETIPEPSTLGLLGLGLVGAGFARRRKNQKA